MLFICGAWTNMKKPIRLQVKRKALYVPLGSIISVPKHKGKGRIIQRNSTHIKVLSSHEAVYSILYKKKITWHAGPWQLKVLIDLLTH